MKSWKVVAGGLLLLASYVAFPYYATRALGDALRSGEREQLERSIDFISLRASLRGQLDSRVRKVFGDDPLMDGLADVLGAAVLDKMIDVYLTPPALAALIEHGKPTAAAVDGVLRPDGAKDFRIDLKEASWAFFSDPTTFRLELPNSTLKLRLQSWWWQLVDVQLRPEPETPGGTQDAPKLAEPRVQTQQETAEPPTLLY